jgi:putative hydrolase of HD superfamily
MTYFFMQSPRLGFRTWESGDLPLAQALWGHPQVARFIHARGAYSPEEAGARLEREIEVQRRSGIQYWPVFELASGAFVGCCGLRPYGNREGTLELGAHLLPEFWGRGLGREACRRVIAHAFEDLGAAALFAGHHPDNAASRGLLAKLGFTYTHDEFYPPTGLRHPSYLLEKGELAGTREAPQADLVLRGLELGDLDRYQYWKDARHPHNAWNGPYFPRPTAEELARQVADYRRRLEAGEPDVLGDRKVVADRDSGELLGEVNWYWRSQETLWMELGLVVFDSARWGRGLGARILALWTDELFRTFPDLVRLGLTTWSGNTRMVRLAERLGWRREACYRKARIVDGRHYDSVSYGILREEWQAGRVSGPA